ncbi:MAG: gephyrin-like molybdotransferase Glp [Candidatus Promineifilaceae bacterium]
MTEFFNVLAPDDARELLLRHITPLTDSETVATADALGRVTAVVTYAPQPLPTFRRSTMDGYAVRAGDTFGASTSLPAFLDVTGEVPMGRAADIILDKGQAALVHTGGMIPETADAVVQVELTQIIGAGIVNPPYEIEVFKAVAPGENVLQIGEDVALEEEMLPAGHILRPQDLGGLLALGITEIAVMRPPRVAILATGDEVISPDRDTGPGQIRDINSYTTAGQVTAAGGRPLTLGIVPDDLQALRDAAHKAMAEADMLVMSAGSSVSFRDMTAQVIAELGEPGVLFHGVATRPGKPTIGGVANGKPVIGLPGNPVSAMVQFDMLGRPAIHRLLGLAQPAMRGLVWATLTSNVASASGREDYVPARLEKTAEGYQATPVFGKSNLIYTLVNADGLMKIPLNKGGLLAGELVEVRLF